MTFALTLLAAVSPFVVIILAWLARKLEDFIVARVGNENLRNALIRLDHAVLTAVKEIQQTTVDAIKKANADGKLTDAEKAEIRSAAARSAWDLLGPKGVAFLQEVLGVDEDEVQKIIDSRIEAAVHDLRQDALPL